MFAAQQILDIAIEGSVVAIAGIMIADYVHRISSAVNKVRNQCKAERLAQPEVIVERIEASIAQAEIALEVMQSEAEQAEASLELAQEVESDEALIARIRSSKVVSVNIPDEAIAAPVPSVEIPDEAIVSLASLSIRQLKALASERQVPRYSRLSKAGLVAALA